MKRELWTTAKLALLMQWGHAPTLKWLKDVDARASGVLLQPWGRGFRFDPRVLRKLEPDVFDTGGDLADRVAALEAHLKVSSQRAVGIEQQVAANTREIRRAAMTA